MEEMEITGGIRQECTGSALLFKMVTYKIMEELEENCKGYKDEKFEINALFLQMMD